ncbi:MAG: alanine--tRNA ligase [Bacteroidia bacterium]
MEANKVRETFLKFFESKGHKIVPSAPMVVKGDPTLMFNNSGMAPFKDIFLGNAPIKHPRVADTQKCLRVSGKHNDLEEVGVDTYHHTMFEMLGNWSFGDYFKKEAIEWAWELLTEVYKLDKSRLYVTVFEGDKKEGLEMDAEAKEYWKKFVSEEHILLGNKKDNFWEMGDVGPCGPCSEIHYDSRPDDERKQIAGAELVNKDHPQVIEIWNNVFMEFERRADGSLVSLPKKHVDTGMGFERLVRVLQNKTSNYDTDIFMPLIEKIEELSGLRYKPIDEDHHKQHRNINIAMRVIADHIRTISFSIADGQLPGSTGAGYVIRRILRRAIRYGYQTLNLKEPFMFRIVPVLVHIMGDAFPELEHQKLLIEKVIREEETSFYKTLEVGLKRIDQVCIEANAKNEQVISGKIVFELYDTYGFPLDLTSLIARGYGLSIDEDEFQENLNIQKDRSRAATAMDLDDWVYVNETANKENETEFIGYIEFQSNSRIVRYRKVQLKNKSLFQIVLDVTPFYSESGGQIGDTGTLSSSKEKIKIIDTKKENGVIIHVTDKLPSDLSGEWHASVDKQRREEITCNHTATHLLHAALRTVLGKHVEQKGSLVSDENLRFDFSHFAKVTDEEIHQIEKLVNQKIRENIHGSIVQTSIDEAKKIGAMALFGEKYGDIVRVVTFDKNYSIELCGGCHVETTGQIGFFKIISEGAVAAGIRRIEAITSKKAEIYIESQLALIDSLKETLKGSKDIVKGVKTLLEENSELKKQIAKLYKEKASVVKKNLITTLKEKDGINFSAEIIDLDNAEEIKNILFEIKNEHNNIMLVVGAIVNNKPSISVIISDNLVKERNLNAGSLVRELAKEIKGGGGGQPFYAQAGGSDIDGLPKVIKNANQLKLI